MNILIHDYAGHPFQVQLSRELARRGHRVTHVYAASIQTPRGALERRDDDPETLAIEGIGLDKPFEKFSFIKRRFQEVEYGRRIARLIAEIRPDWVISGNTPTEPQQHILHQCHRVEAHFAFWVQDFYGMAVRKLLKAKLPLLGSIIGLYYEALDRHILRQSDKIILITEDFRPMITSMGIDNSRIHVIENWAPLEELPLRPKDNTWSREHELSDKFCFLYSGTLGMKHNPALLLELAKHFQNNDGVRVVVISEGQGADWLKAKKSELDLGNLILLPFQPFEKMPEVLAAADVLVAILEPDAGVFSVPSKVLTYLCAGKPILAAMPAENLAARIIERTHSGITVNPNSSKDFVSSGERLRCDTSLCTVLGKNARIYAETVFDIKKIANTFEHMLSQYLTPQYTREQAT